MRKLLTYCPNIPALMIEVAADLPQYIEKDEAGNHVGLLLEKSRLLRKADKSIALIICTSDEAAAFSSLANIIVLANVGVDESYISAMSNTGRAKYDSLYEQTPLDILNESGVVIGTQTVPEMFTDFA